MRPGHVLRSQGLRPSRHVPPLCCRKKGRKRLRGKFGGVEASTSQTVSAHELGVTGKFTLTGLKDMVYEVSGNQTSSRVF